MNLTEPKRDKSSSQSFQCASKTLQRVKASKKELKGAQRKSRRKVAALREARSSEYSITEEARARINKTYADLELNAKVGSKICRDKPESKVKPGIHFFC